MKLLLISKKERERARWLSLDVHALLLLPHKRRTGVQMAGCDVTPQTDEIKPFVLCRESCDMVVGSIRHLHWSEDTPEQLEAIIARCSFMVKTKCRPQFCNLLVAELGSDLQITPGV